MDNTTIRATLRKCIQEYALVLSLVEDGRVNSLRGQLDRLKIWAGNIGVFAPEKASTDFRLRDESNTKSVILGLLRRIEQTCIRLKTDLVGAPKTEARSSLTRTSTTRSATESAESLDEELIESGSDSLDESKGSEDLEPGTGIDIHIRAIEQLIDSLFRLASTIRKPIRYQNNNRIRKAIENDGRDTEQLSDLAGHIHFQLKFKRSMLPNLDQDGPSEVLVNRFTDAAVFRAQRFLYKKRHASKLLQGTKSTFEALLSPKLPVRTGPSSGTIFAGPSVPNASQKVIVGPKSISHSAILSATVASSILVPPQKQTTQPPPSIISQSAIVRHQELDFPPVPRLKSGNDCICPYCCLPLDRAVLQPKNWRQHVLHDLEPYMCVFEHCEDGSKLYSKMDDCMQHMRWKHGTVWACNAPGHEKDIFADSQGLETHLKHSHASAISEAQTSRIIQKSMRPSDDIFESCPLCLDALIGEVDGKHTSSEVQFDVVKRFRNHVAKHLEFLSLLALPPRSDDAGDQESQIKQREDRSIQSTTDETEATDDRANSTDDDVYPVMDFLEPFDEWDADDFESILPPWRLVANTLAAEDDPILQGFVERANAGLGLAYEDVSSTFDPESEEARTCHASFYIVDYAFHKNQVPKRFPGTLEWVFNHKAYHDFIEPGRDSLLRMVADAGYGKSVLARSVVEHGLPNSSDHYSVCYFFFKSNDGLDQVTAALSSIVYEIFSQQPWLLRHGVDYVSHLKETTEEESEYRRADKLWRLIQTVAKDKSAKSILIVLDGIEESTFICRTWLRNLGTEFPSQPSTKLSQSVTGPRTPTDSCLKVLLTMSSENPFGGDHPNVPTVKFSHHDQSQAEMKLMTELYMRDLVKSTKISEAIQTQLEAKLRQLHLKTPLHLRLLFGLLRMSIGEDRHSVESVLVRLVPVTTGDLYAVLMDTFPWSLHTMAVRIASQLMASHETAPDYQTLQLALKIAMRTDSSRPSPDLSAIFAALQGLFRLLYYTDGYRVYCRYRTFEEWSSTRYEAEMALVCVRLLCLEDLGELKKDPVPRSVSATENLARFASRRWAHYVRGLEREISEEMKTMVDLLYDTSTSRFQYWFEIVWRESSYGRYDVPYRMSPVHLAVFNRHILRLKRYLSSGAYDLEDLDGSGRTPLMWAVEVRDSDLISLLLQAGAKSSTVSEIEYIKETAFTMCCEAEYYDGTKTFLSLDHELVTSSDAKNFLTDASLQGGVDMVKVLLDHGVDPNSTSSVTFRRSLPDTPLHAASIGGRMEVVELLLSKGAYIDGTNRAESLPLQAACFLGKNDIALKLIKAGANVNGRTELYGSPLRAASHGGSIELVQAILDADTFQSDGDDLSFALEHSAKFGRSETVELLIRHGVDVNRQCAPANHPLYLACERGYMLIAHKLLEAGAEVDCVTAQGFTALGIASANGRVDCASMLIDAGADVNHLNGGFEPVISGAVRGQHVEVVKLLIARGADVNASGYSNSSLCIACEGEDQETAHEIVQILIAAGADVNKRSRTDNTALMVASSRGRVQLVELLIAHGAEVEPFRGHDEQFQSPLQAAASYGHDQVVEILIAHGAHIDAAARIWPSALWNAASAGRTSTVKLLLSKGATPRADKRLQWSTRGVAIANRHTEIVQLLDDALAKEGGVQSNRN